MAAVRPATRSKATPASAPIARQRWHHGRQRHRRPTETGGVATFTVHLGSDPSDTVTIGISRQQRHPWNREPVRPDVHCGIDWRLGHAADRHDHRGRRSRGHRERPVFDSHRTRGEHGPELQRIESGRRIRDFDRQQRGRDRPEPDLGPDHDGGRRNRHLHRAAQHVADRQRDDSVCRPTTSTTGPSVPRASSSRSRTGTSLRR